MKVASLSLYSLASNVVTVPAIVAFMISMWTSAFPGAPGGRGKLERRRLRWKGRRGCERRRGTLPDHHCANSMVFLSATYIVLPFVLTARPTGVLNRAAAPIPSLVPDEPEVPANVVTALEAKLIALMTWLSLSATYSVLPSDDIATSRGVLNRAAVPMPSVDPDKPAVPASVVTAFVDTTICRIRWLSPSAR